MTSGFVDSQSFIEVLGAIEGRLMRGASPRGEGGTGDGGPVADGRVGQHVDLMPPCDQTSGDTELGGHISAPFPRRHQETV